ncbi:MAG: hypothetical protein JO138_03085 [Acidobacteriaceae bacterium]|nr:hypothetical protein [Acidobacteriaceae bacterium]
MPAAPIAATRATDLDKSQPKASVCRYKKTRPVLWDTEMAEINAGLGLVTGQVSSAKAMDEQIVNAIVRARPFMVIRRFGRTTR